MSVAAYLQRRIDDAPEAGVVDLTGEHFSLDAGVRVDLGKTIVGGVFWISDAFVDANVLTILDKGASARGVEIRGPGRTDVPIVGIRVHGHECVVSDCIVDNIEYCLYMFDVGSDGSQLISCKGNQSPGVFPAPWKGLDYGVVTQNTRDILISGCRILGTRHAVVLGHGTKCSTVSDSFLSNHANVQAVAMKSEYQGKPPAEDCRVVNCDIHGGINLGGKRMTIVGNNVVGRTEHPQTSTALYAPESTIVDYDHIVADNVFRTGTVYPGSKQYGAVYAWAGAYRGEPIFHGNRILIEGDAPAVVGVTGPLDIVPESSVTSRGNVIQRI